MPKIKLTKKELALIIDRMEIEMDWGDKSVDPEYGIYSHKEWMRLQSIRDKCLDALNAADNHIKSPYHVHSKEE